jgi:serine O-acetyltransferase
MSEDIVESLAKELRSVDQGKHQYFHERTYMVPDRKAVIRILKLMQSLMFPDYFRLEREEGSIEGRIDLLFILLKRQITAAYSFFGRDSVVDTEAVAEKLLSRLPEVKRMLIKDVQAIYEGDPAAHSPEEVILCYPGFYAISIYRIAHEFYLLKIPYISRIMTEYAHEKTGIDIHAGATIGERFFIDHGTGIVIGETTEIGAGVKIYQGVTLGARSFELDSSGNPVKGIKRHPNIGNGVVIYANATILGGDTFIGDGAVIGANVWITSSVEAGQVVYYGKNSK